MEHHAPTISRNMGGIGSVINSRLFTQLEYLYTVCDGVCAIIPASRTGTSSCFGPAYSLPLSLSPKLDSPLTSWITFSLMLWNAKLRRGVSTKSSAVFQIMPFQIPFQ